MTIKDCVVARTCKHCGMIHTGECQPKPAHADPVSAPEAMAHSADRAEKPGQIVLPTGATANRNSDGANYGEVPWDAVHELAIVMGKGVESHKDGHWTKGMTAKFAAERALEHLSLYMQGNADDDHLTHALARVAMAVASRKRWPELNGERNTA